MSDDNDRLMDRVARELREPVAFGAAFDGRVMGAVRAMPRHARRGLWSRIARPRTITVGPAAWAALAASLVLVTSFAGWRAYRAGRTDGDAPRGLLGKKGPTAQRVQFVLVAPDAKKVAVVGDFNGWDANHAAYQAVHRGGGVWSVTAPVPLGHHRYSFVVDDSVWVADPTAPRVLDDDYGLPNSALVVEDIK